MSKRYVIQVLGTITDENVKDVQEVHDNDGTQAWFNVQHPKGGDWKTRSRSTAIVDAAKLVQAGETRELRISISKPVYALTPDVDYAAIKNAAEVISPDAWDTDMTDEEADASYDGDEDEDDVDDDAEFELVDETNEDDGNAHNTN